MPAKKKKVKIVRKTTRSTARKSLLAKTDYATLLTQALIIALVGALAIFAILRTAQIRDEVDAETMRVLGASIERPEMKQ